MKKVLVLEDEASIRSFIVINLQRAGYEVVEAECGEEALQKLQENPDTKLCLLDIMLPDIDGFEVCRRIRMSNAQVGIIMLTAKGEENDIVLGLEMGADDYVTKPYSSKVLAARIAARLRKKSAGGKAMQAIVLGALAIDLTAYSATLGGQPLMLTADEFKTLALLAANPGKVFTRNQIIREVKGDNYPVTARAIDMHMVNLRRKLGDWADHIETIRGVGYRISGE